MSDDNAREVNDVHNEPGPPPPQTVAFLITASELQNRKQKRRRKHDILGRSEAIRRFVEIGLKGKGK
jgi:hypothetical protein